MAWIIDFYIGSSYQFYTFDASKKYRIRNIENVEIELYGARSGSAGVDFRTTLTPGAAVALADYSGFVWDRWEFRVTPSGYQAVIEYESTGGGAPAANVGGSFRNGVSSHVNVNGQWRNVVSWHVNVNGQWRTMI